MYLSRQQVSRHPSTAHGRTSILGLRRAVSKLNELFDDMIPHFKLVGRGRDVNVVAYRQQDECLLTR